jgi:acyl carrier protein
MSKGTGEDDLEIRVIAIVADALGHPAADVKPYLSLIDDLGAESIDFMDIVFRLEDAFQTVIPNEQLWAGSMDVTTDDPKDIAANVAQLRQRMPDFNWSRFPGAIAPRDLPRLITVTTITQYLRKHLATAPGTT